MSVELSSSFGSSLIESSVEQTEQNKVVHLPSISNKTSENVVLPMMSSRVWNEKFQEICGKIIMEIIGKLNGLRKPGILSSFELSVIDINSIDGPIVEYLYKRIHKLVTILSLCDSSDSRNILDYLRTTAIMTQLTKMNFFLLKSLSLTDVTLALTLYMLNICPVDDKESLIQQLFANEGLVFLLLANKLYIDYSGIREKSLELLVLVMQYIDQSSRSLVTNETALVNIDDPAKPQKTNEEIKNMIQVLLVHSAPTTLSRYFILYNSIPNKHVHVQRALECLQVIIKQSPLALCKKVGTDNNYAMLRALLLALDKCVGEQPIIDSCIYTLLCLLSGVGVTGISTINKCEWRVLNRNVTGHNSIDSIVQQLPIKWLEKLLKFIKELRKRAMHEIEQPILLNRPKSPTGKRPRSSVMIRTSLAETIAQFTVFYTYIKPRSNGSPGGDDSPVTKQVAPNPGTKSPETRPKSPQVYVTKKVMAKVMPFGNPYIPGKRPLSSSGARQSSNNNHRDDPITRPKSAASTTRSEVKISNINDNHVSALSDATVDQVSNNRFIAEKLFTRDGNSGGAASVTASTSETLSKLSFAEKLQVMIMQMNSTGMKESE